MAAAAVARRPTAFTAPTDLLGGLTPIEALGGRLTMQRDPNAESHHLPDASPDERSLAVTKAPEAHAALLAA